MNFVQLIVYIFLMGLLVGIIEYLGGEMIKPIFRRAIYALCVVFVVFLILNFFGLLPAGLSRAIK